MSDKTRTRRVIVAIVLIVFVIVTTFGMVWHHHVHCTSAQCTLCHLALEQRAAAGSACGMVLARAESAPHYNRPTSRFAARQIPPRAPPA